MKFNNFAPRYNNPPNNIPVPTPKSAKMQSSRSFSL